MERFFLFCFRSCLKGDHDTEYYDILEINNPNTATTEHVKKQYKKLSLSIHPDKLAQRGIEVTAEHKQQFIKIKEAYDVLSDPKRRKLYDELGLSGLKLMENPTEVDPLQILRNYQRNHKDRTIVMLFVALVFAAVLILPILFSLKSDGKLGNGAKWTAIWTPMWVVDIIQFVAAVAILVDKHEPRKNEEGEEEPDDSVPMSERIYNFLVTCMFILIQIFVAIRLDDYTHWSWFAVFIPWYLYEFLIALFTFPGAFLTKIEKPDYDNISLILEEGQTGEEEMFMLKIELESRYFEHMMEQQEAQRTIFLNLLRIWLAIFLALQLDHIVDWNWGLVLLPIWVYLAMQYIYAIVYRSWGNSKMKGVNMEAIETGEEKDPIKLVGVQNGDHLKASATMICLFQVVPLFMAIVLVCRLEVSYITTFVIILPIFIAIGCCCCVVFCGVCMLSVVDMDEMEAELKKHQHQTENGEHETEYNPPNTDAAEGMVDVENGTSPLQVESSGAIANSSSSDPLTAPEQIEVDID